MTQIKDYETITLTADTVVARACVNTSERVYATVNIMNIGDSNVLINTTGDFTAGKYITLPSGTAINDKKFINTMDLYFKADGTDGKVVVNVE
ncbi:MAG: hypothetical protein ACLT5F_09480 [Anaerotignaceae bacterium]